MWIQCLHNSLIGWNYSKIRAMTLSRVVWVIYPQHLPMHIHTWVCVRTYIYQYMCVYMYVYVYMCVYTCICVNDLYMYVYNVFAYIFINMCVYMYVYVYMCVYICKCVNDLYMYVYMWIQCWHNSLKWEVLRPHGPCVCVCVPICVYIYICVYV